jgi:hypothetical protein
MNPFQWWANTKRRFRRRNGYQSEAKWLIRNKLPRPGCLVVIVVAVGAAVAMAMIM